MQLSITDISSYAARSLSGQASGFVHSVYQRTINFMAGGRLIALQSAGSVISPISLIADQVLSSPKACGITPGVPVRLGSGQLTILSPEPVTVSLTGTKSWDLALSGSLNSSRIPALAENILQALSLAKDQGFRQLFMRKHADDASASPILSVALSRTRKAHEALGRGEERHAAQELAGLIGLGIGLTPSGDDFLCGVLAGLRLISADTLPFASALREELLLHLDGTNDISRAFHSCALEHQFSFPVIRLAELNSPEQIYREFSRIGHSSGMDTLSGIYYILTL